MQDVATAQLEWNWKAFGIGCLWNKLLQQNIAKEQSQSFTCILFKESKFSPILIRNKYVRWVLLIQGDNFNAKVLTLQNIRKWPIRWGCLQDLGQIPLFFII